MGAFHQFEGLIVPTLAILLIFGIQLITGQAEMDLADNSSSPTSTLQPFLPEPTSSPTVLRICVDNDALSNSYCKCENSVISCDFSNYSPIHDNGTMNGNATSNNSSLAATDIELDLYGYQFPPNASRFCICNTPSTINLTFSKQHFLPFPTNNIMRFDLYNLRGVTKLVGGFGLNFQGDLYIANVSLIPDIEALEFGRLDRDGEPIPNLQDLKCCSPIQVNQQQQKPLLLIENTTIGLIHTRGLTDIHMWKTFIMKSVHVQGVQQLGIIFDSFVGYNVSIIGSKFENIPRFGMIFKDPSNLLMVKNYFKRSTSHGCWWSRSILNDSNILLMDNIFWNGMFLNMDAEKVVSWFNIYDVWDNYTFSQMRYTSFNKADGGPGSQRSLSFKYNLVNQGFGMDNSLDFGGSEATLSKNVIGTCNCSFFDWRDEFIKPEDNYCFTGSIAQDRDVRGKCSIFLKEAMKECSKEKDSPSKSFGNFCKDIKKSTPGFPGMGSNLSKDIVDARINSNFISLIVHDFQPYFGLNKIHTGKIVYAGGGAGMDINQNEQSHNDEHSRAIVDGGESKPHDPTNKSRKGASPAISIFVTLLVIGFVIALTVVAYKYKHRLVWRRGGHERLIGSQETLI